MSDYNGSIIRAIRGPVILITIGGLFALNNFTRYRFDQTWPVILIVFGLLSLLRRGTQPAAGPASAPGTPPPYGYPAPGGYSRSPYAGGPATTPGAPPKSGDPGAPPGGSV